MTHEQMIQIIQAHKEGKTTETRRRYGGNEWVELKSDLFDFVNFEHRIKPTPVPPGDLTWEEAKRLHEEGVKIDSFCEENNSWYEVGKYTSLREGCAYRRAPLPKKVPLGPKDVPPGSVLRNCSYSKGSWSMVTNVSEYSIYLCETKITFAELAIPFDRWEIKRPGQDWQRCEKDEVQS